MADKSKADTELEALKAENKTLKEDLAAQSTELADANKKLAELQTTTKPISATPANKVTLPNGTVIEDF